MEILLLLISAIVSCVIVGIIFYNQGKKIPIEQSKINNDKLKQEQKQLIQENKKLQEDIQNKQNNIRESQQIIKEADELKTNMLKSAEDAHREKVERLEVNYNKIKEDLQRQYREKESDLKLLYEQRAESLRENLKMMEERYDERLCEYDTKYRYEIGLLQDELEKIQKAYKSTVESSKRTAAVQENKDNYRLIINAADANDIKVMESIRHLLVKPRILSMLIWQVYWQPLTKKLFPQILGQERICGIYKITNTETQECYIGQSTDCRDRWNQHCKYGLGIDTPAKNKLYQAMREYGLDKFTFELLEQCDSSELNDREKYYIDMFNSVDFGYNSTVGVNG